MALYRSLHPTEVLVLGQRLLEGDTIELTDEQRHNEAERVALELVEEPAEKQEPPPVPAHPSIAEKAED